MNGQQAKRGRSATEAGAGEAAARPVERSLASRASDDDWPGVVATFGPDWRLAVTAKGDAYALHQRVDVGGAYVWLHAGGRSPATLDRIAAKYGGEVAGLAALCASLPADPLEAAPAYRASLEARTAVLDATDWRRDDYGGEVARDGSLRIVVTPCGTNYRLQWVAKRDIGKPGARWRTVCIADRLCGLDAFAVASVGEIGGAGPDGVLRGDDLLPRWLPFVRGLPASPGDAVNGALMRPVGGF